MTDSKLAKPGMDWEMDEDYVYVKYGEDVVLQIPVQEIVDQYIDLQDGRKMIWN